ncbi:MAG: endonuclease/exonuclease/phosphatase family protein [Alcaligenaceae bacterium]|nr:endonuclease/exonuclease/phosphatase family protein [Alcaligenaceae bacterium]
MITVASYNIRKSVGLDWRRNACRIQSVIAELNADVVLLQEVDKRFGARDATLSANKLLEKLGYQFVPIAVRDNSLGWHGNAILYRKPLQLLACQCLEIPMLEPRGAVTVSLRVNNDQVLQVVGTHLSLLKSMRQQQILAIIEQLKCIAYDYIVIGGDFNEAKAEQWFNQPEFSDYNLVTPGLSFHATKPIQALDRFIIGPKLILKHSAVHQSLLSERASDHFPVTVQLEFPL